MAVPRRSHRPQTPKPDPVRLVPLAALLGASPGASVSAHIALQILQTCFPDSLRTDDGHARMQAMIPTFDLDLASPAATADHARRSAQIDAVLQLHHLSSTK